MSAVVHPDALREENFDDLGHYQDNLFLFLRGIHANGLILSDPQGILLKKLRQQYDAVPFSKIDSRVKVLLEELFNPNSRTERLIICREDLQSIDEGACLTLVETVGRLPEADGIFDEAVLSKYILSAYEEKRDYYQRLSKSLHKMGNQEIEDAIIRSVRFSRRLRFFDSQLGKDAGGEPYEEKCQRFYDGLAYIVDLWKRHGHFFSGREDEGDIEIITPIHRNTTDVSDIERVKKVITAVLIEPLSSTYKVRVALSLKRDRGNLFHDRFLDTESAILGFGRGFDLFTKTGKFKSNTVKLVDDLDSLGECYRMEPADLPMRQSRR